MSNQLEESTIENEAKFLLKEEKMIVKLELGVTKEKFKIKKKNPIKMKF